MLKTTPPQHARNPFAFSPLFKERNPGRLKAIRSPPNRKHRKYLLARKSKNRKLAGSAACKTPKRRRKKKVKDHSGSGKDLFTWLFKLLLLLFNNYWLPIDNK